MISVVIPAYNCEQTIEKAVHSVLSQTYREFELIIVNDGSTDGTEQMARRLEREDTRIKVITTENSGEGRARNRCIEEAVGEYLCFIDSDDWVEPEFLEALIDQAGEGILPCVGMSNNGDGISLMSELPGNAYQLSENPMDDFLGGPLQKAVLNSVCNKLFDAAIVREHDIRFYGGFRVGEDFLFTIRYLPYCKKVTVDPRTLYCYYNNTSSVTRSAVRDVFPAYEKLLLKMIELKEIGIIISEEFLQAWSFDKLICKVCNGYPQTLTVPEFKDYFYHTVFVSRMYQYAILDKSKVKFQRRVFRSALRRKNVSLLLALIQGKNALQGKQRLSS